MSSRSQASPPLPRTFENQALGELGVREGVTIRWRADLRYAGQGFELLVDLDADVSVGVIRQRFEQEYRPHLRPRAGKRRDRVRRAEGRRRVFLPTVPPERLRMRRPAPFGGSHRSAYFGKTHGLHETPVIGRNDLASIPRRGPLIIEEYEGTTVVPPHAQRGARRARQHRHHVCGGRSRG